MCVIYFKNFIYTTKFYKNSQIVPIFAYYKIVKYSMEKLQANKTLNKIDLKIDANNGNIFSRHRNKENINDKIKTKNNLQKSNWIKCIFKKVAISFNENKFSFIAFSVLLILNSVLVFMTFSNSTYFMFLKRPKILENGFMLSLIIFLFLLLLYSNFLLETLLNLSNKIIDENPKNDVIKRDNEKVPKQKKYKKSAYFNKKSIKNYKFKLYFLIFVQILALVISFHIQCLWLCVFISFCIFFTIFLHLFKTLKKQNRIFDIVLILNFLCVLLSFYFIYLYN